MHTRTLLWRRYFWLALMMAFSTLSAKSLQTDDKNKSIFDHLSRQDVLEITIETDLSSLINKRKSEVSQSATLSYEDETGNTRQRSIELKTRGKFRRRICQFPPLKLKFSKSELKSEGLAEFNDIKLVTHCLDDKDAGQDYLLREYLIYKLYNELTPNSFNVQLAQVTYIDKSTDNLPKIKRYAFLMEDKDQLAQRLGGEICDCLNPAPDSLSVRDEQTMALFEYMVGNTDWDMSMNRNLLLVKQPQGNMITVGYDFDFSGLVNASYALPNTNHGLRTVRDRIYMGMPASNDELKEAISLFRGKRSRFLAIVDGFKRLEKGSREDVKKYITDFYAILDSVEAERTSSWHAVLVQPHPLPAAPANAQPSGNSGQMK